MGLVDTSLAELCLFAVNEKSVLFSCQIVPIHWKRKTEKKYILGSRGSVIKGGGITCKWH